MKVDLGIWAWLNKLIVVLLAAAAVVGVVVWYLPLIKAHEAKRLELYRAEQELARLIQESNRLSQKIETFARPENIERLGRELGLARTNEYVLHMIQPTNPVVEGRPPRR